MARLPRQDPFLEPGEPYLFVVRFEGVRPLAAPDDDVVDEQPVGELVTWVSAPTRSLE